MALLIDDLVEIGVFPAKSSFDDPVVILANNVSEYYFMGNPQEVWTHDDFPNIAPPFEHMWFEWDVRGLSNSEGKIIRMGDGYRCGMMVGAISREGLMEQTLEAAAKRGFIPETKPKWVCFGEGFVRIECKAVKVCNLIWCVGEDGGFIGFGDKGQFIVSPAREEVMTAPDRDMLIARMVMMTHIPFLAMSFMHCKNVELEKGPAIPVALQKARAKKGKHQLFRYKTLIVEPIRKMVEEHVGGDISMTRKALHICRGHFKDYRQRGLFGKVRGTFWWGMQTRGAISDGDRWMLGRAGWDMPAWALRMDPGAGDMRVKELCQGGAMNEVERRTLKCLLVDIVSVPETDRRPTHVLAKERWEEVKSLKEKYGADNVNEVLDEMGGTR